MPTKKPAPDALADALRDAIRADPRSPYALAQAAGKLAQALGLELRRAER